MSSFDNGNDAAGDSVDDLGRRAGSELRRPAPAAGLANVQRSHRRRRAATAAGGLAVAAIAIGGGMLLVNRGGDDTDINISDSTIDSSIPATTVEPTPATTVPVPTTRPGTPTTNTTVAAMEPVPTTDLVLDTVETVPPVEPTPTTEPVVDTTVPDVEPTVAPPSAVAESTWVSTEETWPWFTGLGVGTRYWPNGVASPPIPEDPDEPLAPGAYWTGDVSFGQSSATIEVRPFVRCDPGSDFDRISCEEDDTLFDDEVVGYAGDIERTLEIALDERVTVHLWDFDCETGTLDGETWVGSGADLGRLVVDADASVDVAVLQPLRDGVDPVELADSLRTNEPNGISDPGCPGFTEWLWTAPSGPSLMINLFLPSGVPVNPDLTQHRHVGIMTGLEVADDGTHHLYYFAGWTS